MKAGTAVDITILGDKKLQRKLKGLTPALQKKALRKALRAGAKIVAATARQMAPKRTGAVKRSIKVKAMKRSRGRLGVQVVTGEGWFIGPEFYAAFVELGHHIGRRGLGGQRTHVPGSGFLRKAARQQRGAALGAIRDELARAVTELARR